MNEWKMYEFVDVVKNYLKNEDWEQLKLDMDKIDQHDYDHKNRVKTDKEKQLEERLSELDSLMEADPYVKEEEYPWAQLYLIFQLLRETVEPLPFESKLELLFEIVHTEDSEANSYEIFGEQIHELTCNFGLVMGRDFPDDRMMNEAFKVLVRDKKVFLRFMQNLQFVMFVLNH